MIDNAFCNACYQNAYLNGTSWNTPCENFYQAEVWPLHPAEYCSAVPLTDFLPLLIIAGLALAIKTLYYVPKTQL